MRKHRINVIKTGHKKVFFVFFGVIMGTLFVLSGCQSQSAPPSQSAQVSGYVQGTIYAAPLVYEKDAQVYLSSGGKSISLGSTGDLYTYSLDLNMMLSGNNEYLYYIDYKGSEDAGDLMRVKTDALSAPEKIAEGVCAAQPSEDGVKALYITGISDISGTLYLKDGGSEPRQIAQYVLPGFFGFSPGGSCIYYAVQQQSGAALYIKKGTDEAEMVTKITGAPKIKRGVNIGFDFLAAGEDGQMLYTKYIEDTYDRAAYLFKTDGTTETINEHCLMLRALGSPDELLSTTDDGMEETLWYKAPGKQAEVVAQGYYDEIFEGDYMAEERDVPATGSARDRQFLILDQSPEGDTEALYLHKPGSDKVKIAEADTLGSIILGPGGCAVYQKDDGTYVSRETAAGRKEVKLSEDFIDSSNIYFDDSERALYYVDFGNPGNDSSGDTQDTGNLIKYSIKDGTREQLMNGVNGFELAGDTPYAYSNDGWVYMVKGQNPVRVAHNYDSVSQAAGGVYLSDENGGIAFAAQDGSLQIIANSAVKDEPQDSIRYYPPMSKDPAAALDSLADDAYYYLSQLDTTQYFGYPKPFRTLEQDKEISDRLSVSALGDDAKQVFLLFSQAFGDYALWQQSKDSASQDNALSSVQRALDNYNSNFS